jgi:hypothetical protein
MNFRDRNYTITSATGVLSVNGDLSLVVAIGQPGKSNSVSMCVDEEASMPDFSRTLVCLVVMTAASALAQTATAPAPLEVSTTDDCAIYSVALTDLYGKHKIERIVLIDQTSTGFPPGMAATTQFGGKAQPLLKDFPKEAKEDFEARNKTHAKIEAYKVKTSFEIVLLDVDAARKLVEGGDTWKGFREKYPNSPGITLISRPGIDADKSHALLYVGNSCDMLCGGGTLIFLSKENGEWKVANKVTIWVS